MHTESRDGGIISTISPFGLSAACIGCRGEYMDRYYLEQPTENVKAQAAKRGEKYRKCKIRILKSDVLTSVIALCLVPIMNITSSCTFVLQINSLHFTLNRAFFRCWMCRIM